MKKEKFQVFTEYDCPLDIYTITVVDDFEFDKSLELSDGVILDFDKKGVPISIEILDISKKLGISKGEISSAKTYMEIICTSDILKVEIRFYYKVNEKDFEKAFNSKLANNFNIPPIEMITA